MRLAVGVVLAVRLEVAAVLAERFGVDAVLVERFEVAAVLAVRFDDAVLAVTVAMSDSFLDLSFEPNAVRCTRSSRTAGPNDRRVPHAGWLGITRLGESLPAISAEQDRRALVPVLDRDFRSWSATGRHQRSRNQQQHSKCQHQGRKANGELGN